MNEWLINKNTFNCLEKYDCGLFSDDRFPKGTLSEQNILNHSNLKEIVLRFSKLTALISESIVKIFRDPISF